MCAGVTLPRIDATVLISGQQIARILRLPLKLLGVVFLLMQAFKR